MTRVLQTGCLFLTALLMASNGLYINGAVLQGFPVTKLLLFVVYGEAVLSVALLIASALSFLRRRAVQYFIVVVSTLAVIAFGSYLFSFVWEVFSEGLRQSADWLRPSFLYLVLVPFVLSVVSCLLAFYHARSPANLIDPAVPGRQFSSNI